LGHSVVGIEFENRKIKSIICERSDDGNEQTYLVGEHDFVVSTLPLWSLPSLIQNAMSDKISDLIKRFVKLNDLCLVFLHIDTHKFLSESWVFVPDPEVPFHRLSEQGAFDPGMIPRGSIVCCEIMSNEDRRWSEKSDQELADSATRGLAHMGYSAFKVLNQRVIRLRRSYPVFLKGFQPALASILKELDNFENFRTIGRQGAFNYIGTLDAMDIGYGFARWLEEPSSRLWERERERTGHYPVLD